MAKATHYGECQVCGHVQKLPAGKLALHGYTTRAGFFEGTCHGSRELPFEVSIHLILDAIERAKGRAKELRAAAKEAVETASPASSWYHKYVPAVRVGRAVIHSHYVWIKAELTTDDRGFVFANVDGKTVDLHSRDAAGKAKEYAANYATHLRGMATQADNYVIWQNARIKGWSPKALLPVEDVEATRAAAKKVTIRTKGAKVCVKIARKDKTEAVETGTVVASYSGGRFMGVDIVIKLDNGGTVTVSSRRVWLAEAK